MVGFIPAILPKRDPCHRDAQNRVYDLQGDKWWFHGSPGMFNRALAFPPAHRHHGVTAVFSTPPAPSEGTEEPSSPQIQPSDPEPGGVAPHPHKFRGGKEGCSQARGALAVQEAR